MRHYHKLLFSLTIATAFLACNDDDTVIQPDPKPNVSYPNYSNLEVGNYWIYERFTLKPNGEEISLNQFDSSYVEKDTMIRGEKYFKLFRPSININHVQELYLLRDSLHYIVNYKGEVLFSSRAFNVPLNPIRYNNDNNPAGADTLFSFERKMINKDSLVNLPAGAYSTFSSILFIRYYGHLKDLDDRNRKTLYAKNIGVVYATLPFFTSNPNYFIQKLVRYNVN